MGRMATHVRMTATPAVLLATVFAGCGTVEIGKAKSTATLAGGSGGPGFFDGAAATSSALIRFDSPSGVAAIGTDVFVADSANHVVRKINAAGDVSTVAGTFGIAGSADGTGTSARFNGPTGLAADGTILYVCDTGNHTIRKLVTTSGAVTTLAGTPGTAGATDNAAGPGNVLFSSPKGIVSAGGALFVADTGNHKIRKVMPVGATTTYAGSGTAGSADGVGTAASFSAPEGIAAIGTDLYVADTGNDTIRKVASSGAVGNVTTLAGSPGVPGTADGTGTVARFNGPAGIAAIGTTLYVADTGNHAIRAVNGDPGVVTTLAGVAGTPGSADGTGSAARFFGPRGIGTNGAGLFVADTENQDVRTVTTGGAVATLAGNPPRAGSADDAGTAARFNGPAGAAVIGDNVYVADAGNHTIRKITGGGTVTTLAGAAGIPGNTNGTGTAARFNGPVGIASDGSDLFVADTGNHTIRKVTAAGVVTTIAGSPGLSGSVDGTGSAARFNSPRGIVVVGTDLFVADTGNHTIRKVTAAGVVTTVAGGAGIPGSTDASGTAARFDAPRGIATLGSFLFVADTGNHTIRRVALAGFTVITFAGAAGQAGAVDGSSGSARFSSPEGIAAVESVLYLADRGNHAIRKISTLASVTTFVGDPAKATTRDGDASQVLLNAPTGIAGSPGVLYFTDGNENVVRKILF